MPHNYLLKEFQDFARSAPTAESLMEHISERSHKHIPRHNWVGFYLLGKEASTLVLGPHAGSFTPKPVISLDQGLCGAAASQRRTVIADNVAQDSRYIQASDLVKSQISVPVVAAGRALAVMNVESYFASTFSRAEEREFVEACAGIVAKCFEGALVPVHV